MGQRRNLLAVEEDEGDQTMKLDSNTKLALYAGAGIAAVAGLAYLFGNKQTPLSVLNPAAAGYNPSNGTHALTVPVGTTAVINVPSGGTITPGDTTIATVGANTVTGVKAGQTTVSIAWTPTGGTQQNDSVVVTVP